MNPFSIRRWGRLLWVLLLVWTAACTASAGEATAVTPAVSAPASPAATVAPPTRTAAPPTATATPRPTATPTPALPEPQEAGEPLPANLEVISLDNVERLQVLARWGKGQAGRAAWSPDGRFIAVPARHGVYIYDAQTLEEVHYVSLVPPEAYLNHEPMPVMLPDGNLMLISGQGLYDTFRPRRAAFSPDGRWLAVGWGAEFLEDGPVNTTNIKILDTTTWEVVASLNDAWPEYEALVFSPDGRWLAVGKDDGVALWEWEATDRGGRVSYHAKFPLADEEKEADEAAPEVAFSPDGQWLAAVGPRGFGYLWRLDEPGPAWKVLRNPNGESRFAVAVAFSPDSQMVVFAGQDHTLRGYQLPEGRPLPKYEIGAWCTALRFVSETQLACGSLTGEIVLWDMATNAQTTLKGDPARRAVEALMLGPEGNRLLVQRAGSLLEILDLTSGEVLATLTEHRGDGFSRPNAYAPAASLLAFAEKDTVVLVNADTGEEVGRLRGGGYAIAEYGLALSPDGTRAAVGYEDASLWLWDVPNGQVLRELRPAESGYTVNTSAVAFSPDGQVLASVGYDDRTLVFWDPRSGRQLFATDQAPDSARALAFSPDGQVLAVGGDYPAEIQFWDVTTHQLRETWDLGSLPLDEPEAWEVLFSPTGEYLAVNGPVFASLLMLEGPMPMPLWEGFGTLKAFSPDGTLVVGGSNGAIRDAATGMVLRGLIDSSVLPGGFYFSPDGTRLYMIHGDGTIWVWGVPAGD